MRLSEKRINQISSNVSISLEVEGFNPSFEAIEISKKFLRGEISDKKAKNMILELYKIEYK